MTFEKTIEEFSYQMFVMKSIFSTQMFTIIFTDGEEEKNFHSPDRQRSLKNKFQIIRRKGERKREWSTRFVYLKNFLYFRLFIDQNRHPRNERVLWEMIEIKISMMTPRIFFIRTEFFVSGPHAGVRESDSIWLPHEVLRWRFNISIMP